MIGITALRLQSAFVFSIPSGRLVACFKNGLAIAVVNGKMIQCQKLADGRFKNIIPAIVIWGKAVGYKNCLRAGFNDHFTVFADGAVGLPLGSNIIYCALRWISH